MNTMRLEDLTIKQYLENKKEGVHELLRCAVKHAIEKGFDLYMTYDKSCEPRGGSIPTNILINSIIDLTHKQPNPRYQSYKSKSSEYYQSYYGSNCWKKSLLLVNNELDRLIQDVVTYQAKGHSAFPSDQGIVASILHAAWMCQYPLKINKL